MQTQSSLSFLRRIGIIVIGIAGVFLSYYVARVPFLPNYLSLKYAIIILCITPIPVSMYRRKRSQMYCFVVIVLYVSLLILFTPDYSKCIIMKSDHGKFYKCFIGSEYITFEVDQNGITMSPISPELD